MSKIIVLSLDGAMDSPAGDHTHIQNIQVLLGDKADFPASQMVLQNRAQGWNVSWHYDKSNRVKIVSYYDAGQGAPTLNKKGEIIGWSIRPLKFAVKLKNTFGEISEAALGCGIIDNVAQAYHQLAVNYNEAKKDDEGNIIEEADKVYAFGFSRGAYTLRLLTTMIRSIGLINIHSPAFKKEYGDNINQAIADGFALYQHKIHPDQNELASDFKQKYCHDGRHLIHFMGLLDPVKGWIIEDVPHDKRIGNVPKYFRQICAADEKRDKFSPVIGIPSLESNALSIWMPGVHSDIGGGYPSDTGLANLSLHCMLEEAMRCGLPVNIKFLNRDYPVNQKSVLAPQHNSMSDNVPFTNGLVQWSEISASKEREIAIHSHGETLHPSIYTRLTANVYQQNDQGQWEKKPYEPANVINAINALNDPKKHKEPQRGILLFNSRNGYKVPTEIPAPYTEVPFAGFNKPMKVKQ